MRRVRPWLLVLALPATSCRREPLEPSGFASTADVHHFVAVWHRLDFRDTSCTGLQGYIDSSTAGLRAYLGKFNVGARDICHAIVGRPEDYGSIEEKLPALDSAAKQITSIFEKYRTYFPEARAPSVYFVVGTGISAGSTTTGNNPRILVGVERARSVVGMPSLIAHEFVHTVQDYPLWGSLTGGPGWLRGSLLRQSVKEGSADFLAELVTGVPHRNAYGEAHEMALWQEFQRERRSTDYSRWLYNGWNARALGDRPADLGYWMGYRITKAYYERAPDKAKAIRDIVSIKDFDRFLAQSGYEGQRAKSP